MLLMGVLGKIGAVFTTIPTPVVGGMFLIMFGVISAAGISNLQVKMSQNIIYKCTSAACAHVLLTHLVWQFTDMNSSRNIFVFGFSMFSALVIPNWIMKNPDHLKTGIITTQERQLNHFRTVLALVLQLFFFFFKQKVMFIKAESLRIFYSLVLYV